MARVKSNPFPGTDYTQYASWKPVTLPSGEVYYEIPGHPGYVYIPAASNATGIPVIRPNPKGEIEANAKAEADKQKALDQQSYNQSPLGQMGPVAAGTLGTVGSAYLINSLKPESVVEKAIADKIAAQTAANTGQAVTQAALPQATTQAAAAAQGASGVAPALATTEPAFAGAAAGAEGVAAPTVLGNAAGMGVLPLAAIAAGTYLGGNAAYNMLQGKEDNSLQGKGGRVVLGMATGGLSEIARPFLMHESTRDVAKKHTKDLLGQSDDANYQSYVQGMREQYNSAPTDPSKPFAGKYSNFEEYKKAGLDANDLSGVYGNIKTYGAEWANMTPEQRTAVTQANIDSGLYQSKKGEVEITDANKAIENKNNVLKGFQVGAQTQSQAAAQGAVQPKTPLVVVNPAPQTTPAFVRR